jgi:hypothetical protein
VTTTGLAIDRLLPFAVSFAVTCVFFIDVCAWIFDCGCHSLWAGADALCNIHTPDSRHCPFCSHGPAGYAAVMAAVSVPQFALSAWTRWSRTTRMMLCLLLFPAMMGAVGVLLGAYEAYW